MHELKTALRGRGPTEEVESNWLGAEALPGGVVSAESPQDVGSAEIRARPDVAKTWIAAVLSWARRRHLS